MTTNAADEPKRVKSLLTGPQKSLDDIRSWQHSAPGPAVDQTDYRNDNIYGRVINAKSATSKCWVSPAATLRRIKMPFTVTATA